MKLSVIIPLFNRKDLIGYTLDSLQSKYHNGVNLEVIVVDDGSTDGAFEFVKNEYPWVLLNRNPKKGAPSARNYGMSLATSEYVHFLDSDDLVEENYFFKKLQFLENNRSFTSVIGQWDHFNSEGAFQENSIIKLHSVYPFEEEFVQLSHLTRLLHGWYIPINAFVHRRRFLNEIGGFDENLIINQDVDLTFKVILMGSFISVLGSKVLIRQHQNERVGRLNSDEKIEQMMNLRIKFVLKLKESNIWSDSMSSALSEFCFNQWKYLYHSNRKFAQMYLAMSKEYNPNFVLKGGFLLRSLSKILGNEKAYLLKLFLLKMF